MPHPPLLGVTLQSQLRLAFTGIRARGMFGVIEDQHVGRGRLGGNDEGTLWHIASSEGGRIEDGLRSWLGGTHRISTSSLTCLLLLHG